MAIKTEEPQTSTIPSEKSKLTQEEFQEEKAKATKRQTEVLRNTAWSIHRSPLAKCPAGTYINARKGKLVLPKSYRAEHGQDTKAVWADEDLNRTVYGWYQDLVAGEEEKVRGVNFVTRDAIICRKHEYLGPNPHVAGYEVGRDGNIHIRWWDRFLEDQWMGKEKWKIELTLSPDGEWVHV